MKSLITLLIIAILVAVFFLNPLFFGLMYVSIYLVSRCVLYFGIVRYLVVGLMSFSGLLLAQMLIGLFPTAGLAVLFAAFLTTVFCKRHPLRNLSTTRNTLNSRKKNKSTDVIPYNQNRNTANTNDIIDVEVISERTFHRG